MSGKNTNNRIPLAKEQQLNLSLNQPGFSGGMLEKAASRVFALLATFGFTDWALFALVYEAYALPFKPTPPKGLRRPGRTAAVPLTDLVLRESKDRDRTGGTFLTFPETNWEGNITNGGVERNYERDSRSMTKRKRTSPLITRS